MSKNHDSNAFIGYLLHDLKSPLAVISAYSTMIKMHDPEQIHSEKIDTIQEYIRSIDKLLTKFQEFNRIKQTHIKRVNFNFFDEFEKVQNLNNKLFMDDENYKLTTSFKKLNLHADVNLVKSLVKNLLEFAFENKTNNELKFKFNLKQHEKQIIITFLDNNKPIENTDILQLFYADHEIKKPNLLDAFRLAIIHDICSRHKWDIEFKVSKQGHSFIINIDKKDVV